MKRMKFGRIVLIFIACLLAATAGVFSDFWATPIFRFFKPATLSDLFTPKDSRIATCESLTLRLLKSPGTYKRVDAVEMIDVLFISFDSQNGYGALLRSQVTCVFDKQGRFGAIKFNDEEMKLVDSLGNIEKSVK